MFSNTVRRMLDRGDVPLGLYCYADSTITFEVVCRSGVDYVIIPDEESKCCFAERNSQLKPPTVVQQRIPIWSKGLIAIF